jgi:hypothetical protein
MIMILCHSAQADSILKIGSASRTFFLIGCTYEADEIVERKVSSRRIIVFISPIEQSIRHYTLEPMHPYKM